MNTFDSLFQNLKIQDIMIFILIIAVLYLLFRSPPCTENFETPSVDAIKNLGDISRKIYTGGDTGVPGTLTIPANNTIFSGDVTISGPLFVNKTITYDANINGNLTANGSLSFMPKGSIIMWAGAISEIPPGWCICDSSNGSPDLRGRFILGAGNIASTDNTTEMYGGWFPYIYTGNELTFSIGDRGGADYHKLSIFEMPSHSHTTIYNRGQDCHSGEGNAPCIGGSERTGFEGGDGTHNNMPPFYVLAYIYRYI